MMHARTLRTASRRAARDSQRGFTLVEILVVVTILAGLAAMIVPNLIGQADKANRRTARTEIGALESACEIYKLDTGSWPNSLEDLINDSGVTGWDGPYLKQSSVPLDPWNNAYQYETVNARQIRITSSGGGEDPITNMDQ